VIPNVKKVGSKANLLALGKREILDDGQVPVLLKGLATGVASFVPDLTFPERNI
jgi:hypothetical protein